ncbi:hypothetical protein GN244_ATG11501 [Phytophthora infestans]|uniref:Uncharacterized protein n=1 Tax=Phytophthora infestans TaxID=4787 RepID=A0A833S8B5_PHYIN|nr:hypothetical protein GN244_ATG11501 [Phytophthora infestans]
MVGLSLRELPEETLHPGDTSEYHSWMFVGGDPRGQCIARVLRISQNEDPEYPIRVDTGEMLSERQVMRRISDASGVLFKVCKWRKLRTYIMKDGEVNLPTMSSRFNSALRQAVADGWAAASKLQHAPVLRIRALRGPNHLQLLLTALLNAFQLRKTRKVKF